MRSIVQYSRFSRYLLAAAVVTGACALVTLTLLAASPEPNREISITPASVQHTPHPSPLTIQLCQALSPAPCISGVDCSDGQCGCNSREPRWNASRIIPFQLFAQGEYCGLWRTQHVPEYRLRVDDQLEFVYRLTREEQSKPYELNVGDEIRVESFTDEKLNSSLIVQPDGTITLRLLGQVRATHRTVTQLRDEIDKQYVQFYKMPSITITPIKVNTRLEDLRATVDARAGSGGQKISAKVSPEGTISLPALVSVPAQGLTLAELKREIDEQYSRDVEGIEVTPILTQRAPRYVFVLGEVNTSGRFTLEGPTTVTQALAMAGSWKIGANLRQIVVFRRAQDWHLMATVLDLQGALRGKRPCPADEIWLNDSDIILVPKSPIQHADEFIEMVFTRGLYGVFPISTGVTQLGTVSFR